MISSNQYLSSIALAQNKSQKEVTSLHRLQIGIQQLLQYKLTTTETVNQPHLLLFRQAIQESPRFDIIFLQEHVSMKSKIIKPLPKVKPLFSTK